MRQISIVVVIYVPANVILIKHVQLLQTVTMQLVSMEFFVTSDESIKLIFSWKLSGNIEFHLVLKVVDIHWILDLVRLLVFKSGWLAFETSSIIQTIRPSMWDQDSLVVIVGKQVNMVSVLIMYLNMRWEIKSSAKTNFFILFLIYLF